MPRFSFSVRSSSVVFSSVRFVIYTLNHSLYLFIMFLSHTMYLYSSETSFFYSFHYFFPLFCFCFAFLFLLHSVLSFVAFYGNPIHFFFCRNVIIPDLITCAQFILLFFLDFLICFCRYLILHSLCIFPCNFKTEFELNIGKINSIHM